MCVCVCLSVYSYICVNSHTYMQQQRIHAWYTSIHAPLAPAHTHKPTHTPHTHTQPESGGLLKWFNGHKKQASSPDGGPMLHLQAWILAKPNAATPQRPVPNTPGVSQAGTVSC